MGALYSVFLASDVPADALVFYRETFGVDLEERRGEEAPRKLTMKALRNVLGKLEDCVIDSSVDRRQFEIQAKQPPAASTTLVIREGTADDEAVDFYFEKGSVQVIMRVAEALAERAGTLLIQPDTMEMVIVCEPGKAPAIHHAAS